MPGRVYIAKAELASAGTDVCKDELQEGDLIVQICEEQLNDVLWSAIVTDVKDNHVPRSRQLSFEYFFIEMSKNELLEYIDKDVYRQCPECYLWMGKERYEAASRREFEYWLAFINSLSDDEKYLLVACDYNTLHTWELEELDG